MKNQMMRRKLIRIRRSQKAHLVIMEKAKKNKKKARKRTTKIKTKR